MKLFSIDQLQRTYNMIDEILEDLFYCYDYFRKQSVVVFPIRRAYDSTCIVGTILVSIEPYVICFCKTLRQTIEIP